MAEIKHFDLSGFPVSAGIQFLEAQGSLKHRVPFAVVFFSKDGTRVEKGLRLDLAKRAFLDHPFENDLEKDREMELAAIEISNYLGALDMGEDPKIDIDPAAGAITLSGYIIITRAVRISASHSFMKSGEQAKHWKVRAEDALISPTAITAWIDFVNEFLGKHQLTYAPSQLNIVLRYDDRYKHAATTFEDY